MSTDCSFFAIFFFWKLFLGKIIKGSEKYQCSEFTMLLINFSVINFLGQNISKVNSHADGWSLRRPSNSYLLYSSLFLKFRPRMTFNNFETNFFAFCFPTKNLSENLNFPETLQLISFSFWVFYENNEKNWKSAFTKSFQGIKLFLKNADFKKSENEIWHNYDSS